MRKLAAAVLIAMILSLLAPVSHAASVTEAASAPRLSELAGRIEPGAANYEGKNLNVSRAAALAVDEVDPCMPRWGSRLVGDVPAPLALATARDEECRPTPFEELIPANVSVLGELLEVPEGEMGPYIDNGRTMVPLRWAAQAMGATVEWIEATKQAVLRRGDRYVIIREDSPIIRANDWTFWSEATTRRINDRLFTSIRFLAEALGGSVEWNQATRTANISGEPTRFEPSTITSIVNEAAAKVAEYFTICGRVLCLDRSKVVLRMTPAVWELTYKHIDFANDILKAAREVGQRIFVREGKMFIAEVTATGALLGGVVGTATSNAAEVVAALRNFSIVTALPAAGVISATSVGVILATPGVAGMSEAEEVALVRQAEAVTAAAAEAQTAGNYKRDNWFVCYLKQGDMVWRGLPGPSSFFTDTSTVTASQFVASVLFQMLQVPPNPEFGGWRTHVAPYLVLTDMVVACGKVGANPTATVAGYGLVKNGAGGGFQYFIPTWRTTLQAMELQPLKDWRVTDWESLRVIGGN